VAERDVDCIRPYVQPSLKRKFKNWTGDRPETFTMDFRDQCFAVTTENESINIYFEE